MSERLLVMTVTSNLFGLRQMSLGLLSRRLQALRVHLVQLLYLTRVLLDQLFLSARRFLFQ